MQSKMAMHMSKRCYAQTRCGNPCMSPAMPNGRCRMHGGKSTGAPKGNRNAVKHGACTQEAVLIRKKYRALLADSKATIKEL